MEMLSSEETMVMVVASFPTYSMFLIALQFCTSAQLEQEDDHFSLANLPTNPL